MSHASWSAIWAQLEKRTDVATTVKDFIGQYTIDIAQSDGDFSVFGMKAFDRLIGSLTVLFHLQRTYLQSKQEQAIDTMSQYLLQPSLVFDTLAFFLTIKEKHLQSPPSVSHEVLRSNREVSRSIGSVLLSGLRLLMLLRTRSLLNENIDWARRVKNLKSKLREWSGLDIGHRFLILELCGKFFSAWTSSTGTPRADREIHQCGIDKVHGIKLDLPCYNDGLVGFSSEADSFDMEISNRM